MKNKSKKINLEKIIMFYIIIQPILDVATSLCLEYISQYLTVGIFVRAIFMGAITIYSLFKADKKYKLISLIYYVITGIYMCMFLYSLYMQNGTNMMLTQVKGLIRTFYFPIVIVALYGLTYNNTMKFDNKYFIWALLEYSVIIFIAKIAGIAYPTYKYGLNVGTVGLFYSANEIGAILSLISPILFIELLKSRKINIINILTLILFIFAVLEMGTKVPFIAFILLSVICFVICIINIVKNKERKANVVKLVLNIVIYTIILLIIGYTPIGKNIDSNYGIRFIDIKQILEKPEETAKQGTKTEVKPTENIEVTDVVSGRNEFLKNNMTRYKQSKSMEKILGNGYLIYKDNDLQTNKLVEIDYFDIFFSHGIIGTIIAFIPLMYVLIKIIIQTIKRFIQVLKSQETFLYWYIIGMGLGIALAAGHVLTSPAVSIYVILLLLNLNRYLKELEESNQ